MVLHELYMAYTQISHYSLSCLTRNTYLHASVKKTAQYSIQGSLPYPESRLVLQTSPVSISQVATATFSKSITQQFKHNWLIIDRIYKCVKCDLSVMHPGL